MERNNYVGITLNHWWLVKEKHHDRTQHKTFYTLENQANGQVIENVRKESIELCLSGKSQVSKLLSMRMKRKNINSNQGWW